MTFQIKPLDYALFQHLFEMSDTELKAIGAVRSKADADFGFPCRVSLKDADVGDTVILVNYRHLDVETPYKASHAVYVREQAEAAIVAPGGTPEVLTSRLLSVRAFDGAGYMQDGDIIEGCALAAKLDALFDDPSHAFVDIHYAQRGCFAARATRAQS